MANNIREIITMAVIAKGKKRSKNKYSFEATGISKVLGCWVCNHRYSATIQDDDPQVVGTYDLHIWYSDNDGNDSSLLKKQISYVDHMDVVNKENRAFSEDDEIEVTCRELPKCIKVSNTDSEITVEIEKEMAIRVIGRASILVETKNDRETWEEVDDINFDEDFVK